MSAKFPCFAITYKIIPCTENQAAKLERLTLNEIGKEKGASVSSPAVLHHQGLVMESCDLKCALFVNATREVSDMEGSKHVPKATRVLALNSQCL